MGRRLCECCRSCRQVGCLRSQSSLGCPGADASRCAAVDGPSDTGGDAPCAATSNTSIFLFRSVIRPRPRSSVKHWKSRRGLRGTPFATGAESGMPSCDQAGDGSNSGGAKCRRRLQARLRELIDGCSDGGGSRCQYPPLFLIGRTRLPSPAAAGALLRGLLHPRLAVRRMASSGLAVPA